MKACPRCNSTYTDDTLLYCLQDGTPLKSVPSTGGIYPDLADEETVYAPRTGRFNGPTTSDTLPVSQPPKATKTSTAIILTVLGMLILFSIAGVSIWMYQRNRRVENAANIAQSANTTNRNAPANNGNGSPTPTRSATPANANTNTPVDDPVVTKEVSSRVNAWREDSESLDLDAILSHYDDRVDYYRKSSADAAFIRADKQRAFEKFDSVDVKISNISVISDNRGVATAVFDKEWKFEGPDDAKSEGKVRQELRLAKIDGKWLIVAEKDLKLYYKR